MRRTTSACAVGLLLVACNGASAASPDPPCVAGLDAGCAASYDPPAWDTIYANILVPNCAVGTGTCHTADFRAGGIAYTDPTSAYEILLGTSGGTAYVIPGDPACSTIMKRLESTDPSYHMPKGPTSLSAGDLCTIVQWIAQGAPR